MLDSIRHFPPQVYPLTLVSDPDDLLADEQVRRALHARGFRIICEPDSVALRYLYIQAQPVTAERPLIVVTDGAINTLPYDLWQRGRHVELALHRLFPALDYPTIRPLSPAQRQRLARAVSQAPPPSPLAPRATADYLLRHVFACNLDELHSPAALTLWLNQYHAQQDPMPPSLLTYLINQLRSRSVFADWPLPDLLHSADALHTFVQDAWETYVGGVLREQPAAYSTNSLAFGPDEELQDALPRLLRSGVVAPVQVDRPINLPAWSRLGIAHDAAAVRTRQFAEQIAAVREALNRDERRWTHWQAIAWRWAQLTVWRYDGDLPLPTELVREFDAIQTQLDPAFLHWLQHAYGALAGQRLPQPHHLFHVPDYLATHLAPGRKVALLVLDGLSLANWVQIKPIWHARHPTWILHETLLLSQVPSITAVARQALVSGLPPLRFGDSLTHNRHEPRLWTRAWERHGLPARAAAYVMLSPTLDESYPPAVDSPRTQALCLVSGLVDHMVHGATQGVGDVHASLKLWLQNNRAGEQSSRRMEGIIQKLLANQYIVVVTSDHGHVGARGLGQPQEGVTVESRSKRARIYDNEQFARTVQVEYPDTELWHDDGLLPGDRWVLMPQGRAAFAPEGQWVVSHGGLTLEEMVVPLITIAN